MSGDALKVLIVDDSDTARMMLEDHVEDAGYSPVSTGDPNTVVELLERESARILLLDWSMPGKDGHAVLQDIAAYETRSGLKVFSIVITGSRDQQQALKALTSGAFLYLNKPIQPTLLAESLDKARAELSQLGAQPQATPEATADLTPDEPRSAIDDAVAHVVKPSGKLNSLGYMKPLLVHSPNPTMMTTIGGIISKAGFVGLCLPKRSEVPAVISRRDDIQVLVLDLAVDSREGAPFLNEIALLEAQGCPKRHIIVLTEIADNQAEVLYRHRGAVATVPKHDLDWKLVPALTRTIKPLIGK